MEKLIELLNEYAPENFNWCVIDGKIFDKDRCGTIMNVEMGVYVISKQFGFIKWLVDNDKINIDEYREKYNENNLYCNSDFFQLLEYYDVYESLLMTLAISDNSIQDLCAWLK